MCHKHPLKTKPFWENLWPHCSTLPAARGKQAEYCSFSCPCQRPPWEYIPPTCTGLPLHGYKLSHYVNAQLDMKISTNFVYVFVFALPFTVSSSAMAIQTLWFGIPFLQVPTLILSKADLAWNEPYKKVGFPLSQQHRKQNNCEKTQRLHSDGNGEGRQGMKRKRFIWKYLVTVSKRETLKQGRKRQHKNEDCEEQEKRKGRFQLSGSLQEGRVAKEAVFPQLYSPCLATSAGAAHVHRDNVVVTQKQKQTVVFLLTAIAPCVIQRHKHQPSLKAAASFWGLFWS